MQMVYMSDTNKTVPKHISLDAEFQSCFFIFSRWSATSSVTDFDVEVISYTEWSGLHEESLQQAERSPIVLKETGGVQ